jgi:hypothetical protein
MSGLDRAGPDLADATFALFDRSALEARVRRCEFDPQTATLKRPLVQHDPVSESDPVPPADEAGRNYLRWLGERGDRTGEPFPGTDADTILFQLLQHSATLADADAAVGISQPDNVVARKNTLEPEIVDPGSTTTPTLRRLLAAPASQVSAGTISSNGPIGDFLASATRPQIVALHQRHILDAFNRTSAVRAAMTALATRPSAVLDRLAREVLDTCSHRLDAWITSYATRRLTTLRKANATGMHIGGYAWVEDLPPKPPPTPVSQPPAEEKGPLVEDPTNAGFVHGPSLAHAAAAAVLRSAYLSHTQGGGNDGPLAIDLSSDRVRTALWLVDGIRQGQPLGALLGYRFERGLHDRSHPGLELDQFIRGFRALDPLVAGRNEPVAETVEAVEAVAATNVVDGLALVQRFTARPTSIDPALAGATDAERAAVKAELATLVDAVDAVADLLLAESTYQLINGTTARAAASIDALGSGLAPPPELEVATTPRQGYAYTYRVLTLLPPSDQPADGWGGGTERPRRLAEPRLERWAAAFLGPADRIRSAARLIPPDDEQTSVREVTLGAAGLCALDLVYDSQGAAGTSAVEAWLRHHIAAKAGSGVSAGTRVELLHVGDDGWPGDSWPSDVLPLDDALELAAAVANVLGGSRAASAGDLAATTTTTTTGTNEAELATRAQAIVTKFGSDADVLRARLTEAKANPSRLTIGRLRTALVSLASYGLAMTQEALRVDTGPQANDPDAGGRALLTVADLVATEVATIRERLTRADATATERIQAVFGSQFTVTPLFVPTAPAELGAAIAASARPDFLGRDRGAPLAWLQRIGRSRERCARLTLALLYGHTPASGHRLDVAQLPEARRWIALPFDDGSPPAAATSLVVHSHTPVKMDEPLAGLLVDEWVEFVPRRSVTTGIATHIDEPGARAPQALLLAVPPDPGESWSLDALIAVVNEAADLARIRTVAPDEVPWIGRIAPGLYFADNRRDDTLRIDFQRLVAGKTP